MKWRGSRFEVECFPSENSAQQGARAHDRGCHAACYLMNLEMKLQNPARHEARGAPATVVAHL